MELNYKGPNWVVEVHTLLDPIDLSGKVIYAEGTCTVQRRNFDVRKPRFTPTIYTLDNRSNNGKYFIQGKPIYRIGEEEACLQDVFQKLMTIGKQSTWSL